MITLAVFQKVQTAFYKRVISSPRTITLRIYTVEASTDSVEDWVGSADVEYTDYTVNIFDSYTVNPHEREMFGLGLTQVGAVYLSPLQLLSIIGTYTIDVSKTVVILEGHSYLVNYVDYLGLIYSSCIAVKIALKEYIRG